MVLDGVSQAVGQVTAYVVCHGMLYGLGELTEIFYNLFKSAFQPWGGSRSVRHRNAWIGRKDSLKVYGTGQNHIPMIHMVDVAGVVRVELL